MDWATYICQTSKWKHNLGLQTSPSICNLADCETLFYVLSRSPCNEDTFRSTFSQSLLIVRTLFLVYCQRSFNKNIEGNFNSNCFKGLKMDKHLLQPRHVAKYRRRQVAKKCGSSTQSWQSFTMQWYTINRYTVIKYKFSVHMYSSIQCINTWRQLKFFR